MLAMIRGFIALALTFAANMLLVAIFWSFAWYCTPEPLWDGMKGYLTQLHIPPTPENLVLNLSLVTIFIPCLLCRTWLMQRIVIWAMGAHKATGHDYQKIAAALGMVCKDEGKTLEDYNLYVLNEKECNAAAFGKNHIILTRGCIDELGTLPLAGILAHETGHIHNGDTRITLLMACMGFFGNLAANLLNCTVTICGWLMWIPIVNFMLAAYTWAVGICLTLAHYIVDAPTYLITLLFSRYDEYAADSYACKLGYAQELYDGLSYITQGEIPTGFFGNIWSTHPVTKKRLERIQRYIK